MHFKHLLKNIAVQNQLLVDFFSCAVCDDIEPVSLNLNADVST